MQSVLSIDCEHEKAYVMRLKSVGQASLGAKSPKLLINLSEIDRKASSGGIASFFINLQYLRQLVDGSIQATNVAQLVPKSAPIRQIKADAATLTLGGVFVAGLRTWASREFVEFWKRFYDSVRYPEGTYRNNLNTPQDLVETNLISLLEWKFAFLNDDKLKETVDKWAPLFTKNLAWINELRRLREFDEALFERSVGMAEKETNSVAMAVFMLHIARPNEIPIVDQHVV
jgi:hypothetical protein